MRLRPWRRSWQYWSPCRGTGPADPCSPDTRNRNIPIAARHQGAQETLSDHVRKDYYFTAQRLILTSNKQTADLRHGQNVLVLIEIPGCLFRWASWLDSDARKRGKRRERPSLLRFAHLDWGIRLLCGESTMQRSFTAWSMATSTWARELRKRVMEPDASVVIIIIISSSNRNK